ncbi:chaperone protein HscC [Ruminiclostridium hungatei]|uniref:Chaperone protein DnaK n=1 Tax=Ruminiclostridium hungatei TaxID=48256 RepID=A0A1V4SHF0_RUMHU|nr:molecular chaperone HscC [Ruminiclostridium hungatei]OPX43362.1 chaperone protein HscC [Ruminiclostridium hungatei]
MPAIGIDLGTTNSLAAYWSEKGAEIIPNRLGSNLTPSIVSVDDNGEVYIGQIAKERLITHPNLTASVFKRFMGTEKLYQLGRFSFSPEELSSFIIKKLKDDAEYFLGQTVKEAIISVPAYFNDSQRKATKKAAELAGLKVERLISEPTAAAMAYGLYKENDYTKFLVFDLGGGTFDVSILELFEGVMEVKSIAGDNFLGGEDFTELLISNFLNKNKLKSEELDAKTKSIIYKQAESCKYGLTDNSLSKMMLTIDGQIVEESITREEFEKIAAGLLLKLRHPIERALRDAELSPQELDAVILIGGATRMPIIRSAVTKMFGKLPYSNINPDEAVALGAAIQAALKERNEALKEIILTDVCSYSLGVNVVKQIFSDKYEEGYFHPIIERNSPIPVSRVERFFTVHDNQKEIRVEVYQGESRKVSENIRLGELLVKVPPVVGEQSVDVRFTYDINGILEVEVTTVKTGEKRSMIIEKNPGELSKGEISERLKLLSELKIHPREKEENRLLLARGERIYEESVGEMRDVISQHLDIFERELASQEDKRIKIAAKKLKQFLDELESRFQL